MSQFATACIYSPNHSTGLQHLASEGWRLETILLAQAIPDNATGWPTKARVRDGSHCRMSCSKRRASNFVYYKLSIINQQNTTVHINTTIIHFLYAFTVADTTLFLRSSKSMSSSNPSKTPLIMGSSLGKTSKARFVVT